MRLQKLNFNSETDLEETKSNLPSGSYLDFNDRTIIMADEQVQQLTEEFIGEQHEIKI